MKTAMQEWIEWLKAYEYELPLELQIKAKQALEKEKEQIHSSFKAGMDYAEFSVPPNFNNEWEEYYHQTYKKNK